MPSLQTPGVYIQEVALGPSPIQGVSTSVAGFVGEAERGLSSGNPVLVTSFADFQRQFGNFVTGKWLAYAVQGFFANGGQQAFVARVVNVATAQQATVTPKLGYDAAILSFSVAAATAGTQFTIRAASVVGVAEGITITLIDRSGATVAPLSVKQVNSTANSMVVTSTTSFGPGGSPALNPATYALRYASPGAASSFTISARDYGKFGDDIRVLLTPTYLATAVITGVAGASPPQYVVSNIAPFEANGYVELAQATASPSARDIEQISSIDATTNTITLAGGTTTFNIGDYVRWLGWTLQVYYQGALVETLTGITSNSSGASGLSSINVNSQWVTVPSTGYPTPTLANAASPTSLLFPTGSSIALNGGSDGSGATETDIIGTDTPPRTGLKAVEAQEGISIISAPGWVSGGGTSSSNDAVIAELIGQAERKQDRFAVFETVDGTTVDVDALLHERGKWNSQYAAMYAPWVTVLDPLTNQQISVPPAGHIVGAYAFTDNLRGVFKAPANVVLQGIVGFSRDIPTGEQDLLNPMGVNVVRNLPGLGNVIWGARTIAADPLWKYVNVRRLFIFIEQSLVQGTRYAVFEPNDLHLWSRLRDSVKNFLTTQWQAGALFGATPQEAFFVRVDETTTTQDDRDNGIVNLLVGLAPVKPAEFIVFHIGQAPESFIITEQGA
jgi:phage tail sheath protein FI